MQLYKDKLLNPSQLKRLADHKYSYNSSSILDPLLQPWWCWLLTKTPIWLAPNLITILGLAVNILTTLILVWYSPDARIEPPQWSCILCAVGLFVYQSLDAIDGKQARRTGTSNSLGELFDHGCDSISTVFVAISACISVQLGYHPNWMFFQCFAGMTLFYCAHWQAYVSGTLRFGRIDVTEAQYTIITIQLISGIFGPSIWKTQLPVINMEILSIIKYQAFLMTVLQCYHNCVVILSGEGSGKNGSTVAGTSVLSPVIPFSLVIVPAFIIYQKSVENVYETHPILYIFAFGMSAAKVTNRLVVAHMSKSEMEYMDLTLVGPTMLFLNQYFNTFIPEYIVLWFCLIWVTADLIRYSAQICSEMCDHMNVKLFKIPYAIGPIQQSHHHQLHPQQQQTAAGSSNLASERNGTHSRHYASKPRTRKHH